MFPDWAEARMGYSLAPADPNRPVVGAAVVSRFAVAAPVAALAAGSRVGPAAEPDEWLRAVRGATDDPLQGLDLGRSRAPEPLLRLNQSGMPEGTRACSFLPPKSIDVLINRTI